MWSTRSASVHNVRVLGDRLLLGPELRTGRPFPMRFGSWVTSCPSHFDYLTPRKHHIATTANIPRAGVLHFSLLKKESRSHLDSGLLAPRRPHADARLCGDPRGCDGRIRKELAAGIGKKHIL